MSHDTTLAHAQRLQEGARLRAFYLVNLFRQAGVYLIITSSTRTLARQRQLVAEGRSSTLNSAHLGGFAFDVDIHGWSRQNIPAAFWPIIGEVGEWLGLRWGGRWKDPYDPGHFEFRG